ncbi:unnamed protein product [Colias eurytheme]|nr:unnamed protein product [Colias eurytheme]
MLGFGILCNSRFCPSLITILFQLGSLSTRLPKPGLRLATDGYHRARDKEFHALQHHISDIVGAGIRVFFREANLSPRIRRKKRAHPIPVRRPIVPDTSATSWTTPRLT